MGLSFLFMLLVGDFVALVSCVGQFKLSLIIPSSRVEGQFETGENKIELLSVRFEALKLID